MQRIQRIRTVTVIGSGAWGAAFGGAVADSLHVIFWDRNAAHAAAAARLCGGEAKADFADAVAAAELLIIAVNSGAFAEVLTRATAITNAPFVWLTKGFDAQTARPLCAVAEQSSAAGNYAVISGPSFAEEIAAGLPAALALASPRPEVGEEIRQHLSRKNLRLYLENDIVGVCVGGAVKNIIAIAAGISDGMQLGENARAALITRGLSEMSALGEALGGERKTLFGLSGIGDLLLTCSSDKSRNRRLGLRIGENASHVHQAADIAKLATETCEGAAAVRPVLRAAAPFGLRTPIIEAVGGVLRGDGSPAAMVDHLLSRPPAH